MVEEKAGEPIVPKVSVDSLRSDLSAKGIAVTEAELNDLVSYLAEVYSHSQVIWTIDLSSMPYSLGLVLHGR